MHRALGNMYIKEIVCMDPKHIDNVYMVTPELQTGGFLADIRGITQKELTRVQGELDLTRTELAEVHQALVDARLEFIEVVEDSRDFHRSVLRLIDNDIMEITRPRKATRRDTPATSTDVFLSTLVKFPKLMSLLCLSVSLFGLYSCHCQSSGELIYGSL